MEKVQNEKTFAIKAKLCMGEFKDDEGVTKSYPKTVLVNPFDDEDFVDVVVSPRWDNENEYWKYHAKKALRTSDDVELDFVLRPASYKNKRRNGVTTTYPGLFVMSPFSNTEREVEFAVKKKYRDIFLELAEKALGMTFGDDIPVGDDYDGDIRL